MAQPGVLTARDEHLRRIETLLQPRARRGGLVLTGAAGTGKTRLLREAHALALNHGFRSTWVAGSETTTDLTLGAFAGLIEPDALSTAAGLGRAVLELAPPGAHTLICVDDAQLLDHGSALLVHRVVVSRAAVVMMTVRDGQPLPETVLAAWKDRWLDRMSVEPFTRRETRTMLEGVLAGPVHGETVARLWQITAGNPLYLRMLVVEGRRRGALAEAFGWWRWDGPIAIGAGLADVVRSRLGQVVGGVAQVLDLLATSEPLQGAVLGGIVSPSAVEEAERLGVVSVEEGHAGPLVRLAHPLLGEVRRADLGVLAQRRLRGVLAQAMAAPDSGHGGELLRRADLVAGSDLRPDLGLLMEAVGVAAAHSNAPLALRLARAAVRAGAGFPAQAVVAMAVTPVDGPEAARVDLEALQEVASDDTERSSAAALLATHLAWVAGEPLGARRRLATTAAVLADQVCRDRLIALDALIQTHLGEPSEAAERASGLLASPDADIAITASVALAFGDAVTGRADRLDDVVAVGLGVTSPLTSGLLVLPLLAAQALGHRAAGYLERDAAVSALFGSLAEGLPIGGGAAAAMAGLTALAGGRLEDALRLLREARVGLERFGDYGGWAYFNAIGLVQATALAGDTAALPDALGELAAHSHPTMRLLEPDELLARAAAAGSIGSATEAARLAREAWQVAAGRGQRAHEVLALHRLVTLGEVGHGAALAALAAVVDGPRPAAAALHANAWDEQDGVACLAAAEQFAAFGDVVAAAEAAAQAYSLLDAAGRSREARHAQHRVAQLLERCGGARTPTLDAFAHPLPLSAREREVAMLVARGLSNREIADLLVVSVRTIEGHAYRAATKLGVARAEFATAVTPGSPGGAGSDAP